MLWLRTVCIGNNLIVKLKITKNEYSKIIKSEEEREGESIKVNRIYKGLYRVKI